MTLGKGIGGGIALAATLARGEAALFAHGEQGGTYCGNPIATAVGVAVFDASTAPGFLDAAAERGAQLQWGLSELSRRHGLRGMRGLGLLSALMLDSDRAA